MTDELKSESVSLARSAARVTSFKAPAEMRPETLRPSRRRVLVRVTHASVGSTDLMARRGDYLMQPLRGFVTGYDFVGTVEHLGAGPQTTGLRVGQRVSGVLPLMGAHSTLVSAPASLLVAVPDGLESARAAVVPLDAVTAQVAVEMIPSSARTLLVQGASGAVGAWVAQLASRRGLAVYGTTSQRSRHVAEQLGVVTLDYADPSWPSLLRDLAPQGVDAAVDHTGSQELRRVVRPGGRIVRTAFGGVPGAQRSTTARGIARATAQRFGSPAERICSIPPWVATHRSRYRRVLADLLLKVEEGTLVPGEPSVVPVAETDSAFRLAQSLPAGTKVVLDMTAD